MEKSELMSGLKGMKSKLMAAVSMLLVSAILLSNTTYAWFVLANTPEVASVKTTTGANGALEIALQSTAATGGTSTRAPITNGVGQSSAVTDVFTANESWGNIVDVTEGYGLDGITLYPARLNIDVSNNNKVNPGSYLAVPQYGTDGRVHILENTSKTHFVGGAFEDSNNYGVNIHGFKNEMGDTGVETIVSTFKRETVRREAVSKVEEYRNDARETMEALINDNGAGMFDIMFALTMGGHGWKPENTATVESLVYGMDAISIQLESSLRWALLAYAIADTENYSPDDPTEMEALGVIYQSFQSLPLAADNENTLSIMSIAVANKTVKQEYQKLIDAVSDLLLLQGRLVTAKNYLNENLPGNAGSCLVDPTSTFAMKGSDPNKTSDDAVPFAVGLAYDLSATPPITEDDMYMVKSNEESSTNLFSAVATILGDYEADLIAYIEKKSATQINIHKEPVESSAKCTIHMKVTSGTGKTAIDTFSEEDNIGTLQEVYDAAQNRATGDIPVKIERSDVTAYGYSIDLAFQSSEGGELILQQNATTRISGDTVTEAVQGGGSTMSFEIFGNMTAEQVRRLLDSVYVVFMETDSGTIYGVAKAGNTQVTTSEVSADLVMYGVDHEAMNEDGEGVLYLGDPVDDNVILNLNADVPAYVTAIVYLNGDTVNSADVSAEGQMSLIGAINMQFALNNVRLQSMNYSKYHNAPAQGDGT